MEIGQNGLTDDLDDARYAPKGTGGITGTRSTQAKEPKGRGGESLQRHGQIGGKYAVEVIGDHPSPPLLFTQKPNNRFNTKQF